MSVIRHQLIGYSVIDQANLLQIINRWQEYPKNFFIIPNRYFSHFGNLNLWEMYIKAATWSKTTTAMPYVLKLYNGEESEEKKQ
jgi:hypothetical protein